MRFPQGGQQVKFFWNSGLYRAGKSISDTQVVAGKAAKLAYANKTKESITSKKLDSRDFWRIPNSVLNKGKSAIPPLFNGQKVLSSACDKANIFVENFSNNSNLVDSGIPLSVFPSRTTLKPDDISLTPKMVKNVIMNLDLSKAPSPDCIPVVVLNNCEPELSYILAEFFNKCLKESCFPDCWKVLSVVPVFKNVGERSTAKNYYPVQVCQWDLHDRALVGRHASKSFSSTIDRAGNITNFTENRAGKSFFFSQDSKEICYLIFMHAIRKCISGKHPMKALHIGISY